MQSDFLIPQIQGVPPLAVGLGAALVGLVLLFLGWGLYRLTLVLAGGVAGAALGTVVGSVFAMPLVGAVVLGVVGALLAVMLEKFAAFLIGGFCGALPFMAVKAQFASPWLYLGVVCVAFLIGGLLMIYLWRHLVIVGFAIIGATLIVQSTLLIWEQFQPGRPGQFAREQSVVLGVAVLILTVVGTYYQTAGKKDPGRAGDE